MEPSSCSCHFNFWSPNRSKTRPPYLPLALSSSSPFPPPSRREGASGPGKLCDEERAAGPGTDGRGQRGTGGRGGALVALGCPAASRSRFAVVSSRRRVSWDVSAAKFCLRMGWVGGRGRQKVRGSKGKDSDRNVVTSLNGFNNTY